MKFSSSVFSLRIPWLLFFHGASAFEWGRLPDFDCRENADFDREAFFDEIKNCLAKELVPNDLTEYVPANFERLAGRFLLESKVEELTAQCGFAAFLFEVLQSVLCLFANSEKKCEEGFHSRHFTHYLFRHSLSVSMNSEIMPYFAWVVNQGRQHREELFSRNLNAEMQDEVRQEMDCVGKMQEFEWDSFRQAIASKNFMEATQRFVFAKDVLAHYEKKLEECRYGLLALALQKAIFAQQAKTEDYLVLQLGIAALMERITSDFFPWSATDGTGTVEFASPTADSRGLSAETRKRIPSFFMSLFYTEWPILELLIVISQYRTGKSSYQHKPFQLDFKRHEILTGLHGEWTYHSLVSLHESIMDLALRPLPNSSTQEERDAVLRQSPDHLLMVDFLSRFKEGEEVSLTSSNPDERGLVLDALSKVCSLSGKTVLNTSFSEAYCKLVDGLSAFHDLDDAKAVLIAFTLLWGEKHSRSLRPYLHRMRAVGFPHFVVLCLDEVALRTCEDFLQEQRKNDARISIICLPGVVKSIFNKYTMFSAISLLGFDAIYFDFDSIFLQHAGKFIDSLQAGSDEQNKNYKDIYVARDYMVQCLNTGVLFMRSTKKVHQFLSNLVSWMWWHPYEFSQKAFSGFLGVEKLVGVEGVMQGHRPPGPGIDDHDHTITWEPLNSFNEFVTQAVYSDAEGWHGNLEEIMHFHFVDGCNSATNKTENIDAYELFFGNEKLNLTDVETPLYEQDVNVLHFLYQSRWPLKPEEHERKECMLFSADQK